MKILELVDKKFEVDMFVSGGGTDSQIESVFALQPEMAELELMTRDTCGVPYVPIGGGYGKRISQNILDNKVPREVEEKLGKLYRKYISST